ncbi:integrase catalytic subunit [Photorhabdus temperata subsp. temperata M1021]|nr:integrase catalytic subunit [Photorhabdus temperata subsp. temperata M1021]
MEIFVLRVSRSSVRYRSVRRDDSVLRLRIREITEIRVHFLCALKDGISRRQTDDWLYFLFNG